MRIPIYGKVKTSPYSSYRTESVPETYVSKYSKFNNIHSVDVSSPLKILYKSTFRLTFLEDINRPTVIGTNNLFKPFSVRKAPHLQPILLPKPRKLLS